jgi:hypothetical protein
MILELLFLGTIAGILAHAFSGSDESREESTSSSSLSSFYSSSLSKTPSYLETLRKYRELFEPSKIGSFNPVTSMPRQETLLRIEIITERFRAYPSERKAIYSLGDKIEKYYY